MGKRRIIFFRILVSVLFVFACGYSIFDTVREADIFSYNKYEERDSEVLYAEKGGHLDGALVSPTLFSPIPKTFFEFLPGFFSPNKLSVLTFYVLRC